MSEWYLNPLFWKGVLSGAIFGGIVATVVFALCTISGNAARDEEFEMWRQGKESENAELRALLAAGRVTIEEAVNGLENMARVARGDNPTGDLWRKMQDASQEAKTKNEDNG
jgi:hypothetical protein